MSLPAGTEVTFKVVGIEEALREISAISKQLQKRMNNEWYELVKPLVTDAKNLVPKEPPMSGWVRNWDPGGRFKLAAERGRYWHQRSMNYGTHEGILPWPRNPDKTVKAESAKRYVKFGKNKTQTAVGMFRVQWTDPAAVLFDMTGKRHHGSNKAGENMMNVLGARYGSPSRVMWRAYRQAAPEMQRRVEKLVENISLMSGRKLKLKR